MVNAQGPTRSILLVDDDAQVRALVRRYLAHPLWVLDEAESGPVALLKFADGAYDTVLLDIQMPVMDGYEVMRRIRVLEHAGALRRATIIGFSSNGDDDTKARVRDAGCDVYLTKPATHQAIVDAVVGADATVASVDPDVEELMPAFLEAKERELRELGDAIAAGATESARAISHRMQGSFGLYGLVELAALCAEINSLAARNSLGTARARMPVLRAQFSCLQTRSCKTRPAQPVP
jgi:CheY-like chemotaxis protein